MKVELTKMKVGLWCQRLNRVRLRSKSLATRELLSVAKPAWTTIGGVIANARTESLADGVIPQIYRSVYQRPPKT
jgi:hypothetical protein